MNSEEDRVVDHGLHDEALQVRPVYFGFVAVVETKAVVKYQIAG